MTEGVHHFALKTLFTHLDCSQAFHSVQTADALLVEFFSLTLLHGHMPTPD